MAFDLDGFVKELGLDDAEAASVRTALGKPERLTLLEKNQLRQSEFSKAMNGLTKEQQKLTDAQARLDAEAAEWASLSAKEKEQATALRDNLEKSQAKVLALEQRVARIATDAGLDPQKALEGIEQTPVVKKEDPPAFDDSKFVKADQFGTMSEYLFNLSVELPAIAQEHFDLTGERLDTRAIRAEIQNRSKVKGANLDPRSIWEETYKIPEKRAEKATAAHAAEIAAAEQRGADRVRSEAALPIAPSSGMHSPLLRANGAEHKSVLSRTVPESGVRNAAAALATGKYRETAGAAK